MLSLTGGESRSDGEELREALGRGRRRGARQQVHDRLPDRLGL